MQKIVFGGPFAAAFEPLVRPHLTACETLLALTLLGRSDYVAITLALNDTSRGLDVWYRYPQGTSPTWPAEQAFHELPNVLMTPHVAGGTEGTVVARVAVVADNIARLARGERPVNLVKGPE